MDKKEKYAILCGQEENICIYAQPWWLDAVCGTNNWDVLLYEKKDKIVAALPYFVKNNMELNTLQSPG